MSDSPAEDHPLAPLADAKTLSRHQFGTNAANYATSSVHAKGASLARVIELTRPEPHWRALDIATAAGHTALTVAEHAGHVIASDITVEMVALARRRAAESGIANVVAAQTDAEALAFADHSFDLVTSRIAPHHFPDPATFVIEAHRVLRDGGVFALVDNIVPADPDAARWYNDWERRRDPSHVRCLALDEWALLAERAGLVVEAREAADKEMRFSTWADNMSVPPAARELLLSDLFGASEAVRAFLRPAGDDQASATFVLTEGILIARRSAV